MQTGIFGKASVIAFGAVLAFSAVSSVKAEEAATQDALAAEARGLVAKFGGKLKE